MSQLRLYNQLHRCKEPFEPLVAGRVHMYSCGPTVYSRQHLGNLRAYVFADVLRRTLEFFGYAVKHVVNITDVGHLTDDADCGDDKMELAARAGGESVWDVARRITELFWADLAKLAVAPPALWCKATEHIPEQIAMIQELEKRGLTYAISDGIYFDVSRFPHYAEFAGADLAAQCSQERIGAAGEKRSGADFALWKLSPPDGPRRQMEWESPWGMGFPGWHIECSAMSAAHLGVPFDIHTGGADHIPVHHTNEIAQTESATGVRPAVRYWLHNAFVLLGGVKISKSKGHTVNLDDVEARGYTPLAYRYFLLGGHYRQQLGLTWDALAAAQTALVRLWKAAEAARSGSSGPGAGREAVPRRAAELRAQFREALADDLNTPQALAVLWEAAHCDVLDCREKWQLLQEWNAVLQLGFADEWLDAEKQPGGRLFEGRLVSGAIAGAIEVTASIQVQHRPSLDPDAPLGDSQIDALVAERLAARKAREFARADEIRDQLKLCGIVLEDVPGGTRWRRA